MDINQKLTEELDVNRWQIDAAVTLIDEGIRSRLYRDIEKKRPGHSTTSSLGSFMKDFSI